MPTLANVALSDPVAIVEADKNMVLKDPIVAVEANKVLILPKLVLRKLAVIVEARNTAYDQRT